MPNQDLIFPLLPRAPTVFYIKDSKIKKISKKPAIDVSYDGQEPDFDNLIAAAKEHQARKQTNKKLEKLQILQEQDTEDLHHLNIEA